MSEVTAFMAGLAAGIWLVAFMTDKGWTVFERRKEQADE